MLLKDLPIGTRVMDSGENDMRFLVAARGHPGYGGVTLISDCIVGQMCYDAAEGRRPKSPGAGNMKEFGNNDYGESNIHQWLNASGPNWYKPQSGMDEPPVRESVRYGENSYADKPGFLTGFSDYFMEHLMEVEVPYFRKLPEGGGEAARLRARVFLPSSAEMGVPEDDDPYEGERFPIFDDFRAALALLTPQVIEAADWKPVHHFMPFIPGGSFWYWLRTPHEYNSFLVRYYSTTFITSYTYANNGRLGVRCVLNLDDSARVSDKRTDVYVLGGKEAAE